MGRAAVGAQVDDAAGAVVRHGHAARPTIAGLGPSIGATGNQAARAAAGTARARSEYGEDGDAHGN